MPYAANPIGSSRLLLVTLLLLAPSLSTAAGQTTTPQAATITTAAQTTPAISCPILIVRATTPIEKNGEPTLDLTDLERYVAQELAWRTVANVRPSAMVSIPAPAPPGTFLLEISVDALRPAVRSAWKHDENKVKDLTVFTVELSLKVKNAATGALLQKLVQTVEGTSWYGIDDWTMAAKRALVYQAAETLAERFVDSATDGSFGQALQSVEAPLLQRARAGQASAIALLATIAIAAIVVLVVVLKILWALFNAIGTLCDGSRPPMQTNSAPKSIPPPAPAPPTPAEPPRNIGWDKQLREALALWIETENFSEAVSAASAAKKLEETLADAPRIQGRQAERLLRMKDIEEQYRRIAAYAAPRCYIDEDRIIEILTCADEWPYWVLLDAIAIKEGASNE